MSILRYKQKLLPYGNPMGGGSSGGGGGGPTQSTSYQTNLPEYARPYVEAMLGAAQKQAYTFGPSRPDVQRQIGTDESGQPIYEIIKGTSGDITGFRPYVPYGATVDAAGNITNTAQEQAAAAVAPFSPMQEQAFRQVAQMQVPSQFGVGTQFIGAAGAGALGAQPTAAALGQEALGYGATGAQYGGIGAQQALMRAQQTARQAGQYGRMGAGFGAAGAGLAPAAQQYGATAADIGIGGLGYGQMGAGFGLEAARQAGAGFGAGEQYGRMATSPAAMQAYMSPYMQEAVDRQKFEATRDYAKQLAGLKAGAVGAGAFGGSRQAIVESEAQRNLNQQLQNIQAAGTQRAFEQGQQAQQFQANLGLQGLGAGYQGLGMGMQGAGVGLSGLGTAMQGQQAGLQGLGQAGQLYGLGMQGAGLGLQGVGAQQAAGQLGLAGTAQGMQGAGVGLQGVGQAVGAGQYGLAGLGAATQAGSALGNLGAQQLAAEQGIIGLQSQAGAQQQALEQQRVNQAIQNYAMAQQYPQLQLSMMSSLLRGLPLQSTTTQAYQAPPSAISQLGGLGAAGVGLYGMGRQAGIFKEGGVVKLAKGGITGLSKRVLMNPEDFSTQQIDSMTKKGMISQLVGLPVLDAKMKDEQRMKMSQAAQQPTPAETIAAEIQARAAAQGIDNAPSNLPVMYAFDGGIVAMAGGGMAGTMAGFEPTSEEELELDEIRRQKALAAQQPTPPKPTLPKPTILPDTPRPTAGAAPAAASAMPSVDVSGKGIGDILKKYEETLAGGAERDKEAKKEAFWSSLAEFGFGAMAGTSPFAATNIGLAGGPAVKSGMAALRDIRGREEKRELARAQLGLEGEKIKADYTKLGIQEPYLRAMAEYYQRRPAPGAGRGVAGLGSVSPAVADKVMTRFQGYEMDPKSAPFFGQLPKDVQTGLTKYKPGTESYSRSMQIFKQYSDRAMQQYLNSLRGLSARAPVTADED